MGQGVASKNSASTAAPARESFLFRVSLAIPESQLFAWFEQAAPGERIVYCQGYVSLPDDAAWKLAGAWGREGLVHLVTERDGSQTKWIAEKRAISGGPTAALLEAGKGPRSPQRPGAQGTAARIADLQAARLLELLREAAAKGVRCPTKTEMARAVTGQDDQRARNRVTYLRKRLEAEGKITVESGSHKQAPVVTILARGRGCGLSTKSEQVLEGDV